MASSWSVLTDKLYDTITPKWAELGFASSGVAKFHKYLPEHQHSSKLADYFFASIDGATRPDVRCWYVWVRQSLDFQTFNTTQITLSAEIGAYYAKGVNGSGARLLQSHASIIQQEIRNLDINLDGACRHILQWDDFEIENAPIIVDDDEGEVLHGYFRIVCAKPGGVI